MAWEEKDNKWIYIDEDGNQKTGWFEDCDGRWYFLYSDDAATEWMKDSDGRWYYFSTCEQVINGKQYYRGMMVTGWLKLDGKTYYLLEETDASHAEYRGAMVRGCTRKINGQEYTFNEKGELKEEDGVSDKCVDFIKSFEGYSSKAYYDGTGYTDNQLTIGYGTTKAAVPEAFPEGTSSNCTVAQATAWLKKEVNRSAEIIKKDLTLKGVSLKQNEFDALVSFAYNCGTGALFGSTLYKNIVAGVRDKNVITENFQAWSKAGGKRLEGLYRRRTKEAAIFTVGDYTANV